MTRFEKKLTLNVPVETLYDWHAREGAFARLNPPWEPVHLVDEKSDFSQGIDAHHWLKMQMGSLPVYWLARHRVELKNKLFVDMQAQGPFAYWQHQHRFRSLGPERSELIDAIEYKLPLNPFSKVASSFVHKKLERMFAYRHRITAQDILTHAHYQKNQVKTMKILISGASGLVGSALSSFLKTGGHQVSHLVRKRPVEGYDVYWNIRENAIDTAALEGVDAIVHLAGESVAGRWTDEKKNRIMQSRVQGTRLLVDAIAKLKNPPETFICASAIGYYGDQGSNELDETSPAGDGFLAKVCLAWEAEANRLKTLTAVRVVTPRIAVVLSQNGGALEQMLTPFQMGVGGKLGSGQQYMSWIAIDDIVRAFYHCIYTKALEGPVNFSAPTPVKNTRFTQVLAKTLSRPAFFQVPKFALELAMGEMAQEMLFDSVRALPNRLSSSGFVFQYPDLEVALKHTLGR